MSIAGKICALALTAALVASAPVAYGQTCVLGEAPSGDCTAPRQIPGTPGQHVVLMDASNAIGAATTCGLFAGKRVWFEVTPAVSGPVTISTCHPNTTYDTVLEVFSGGDSNCDFMSPEACNDDTNTQACDNGCAFMGSTITINATAGVRYRFVVGAVNDNDAGCPLCLGVIVTIDPTCGDPPTNIGPCDAARELPSAPGTYEVLQDVTDAVVLPSEPGPAANCTFASQLYRTVWYHLVPDRDVLVEFDTCHENTDYDTIVQVFAGTGLCTAGGLVAPVACDDDSPGDACVNSCSGPVPRGSEVSFDATAGSDYWMQVGAYNTNCGGCLGVNLSVTDCSVSDLPVAFITAPPELVAGCACEPVSIVGMAYGQTTPIREYSLEYRTVGNGHWTLITTSTTGVANGVLGQWDTAALAQGYYVLRLTVTNVCGETWTKSIVTFLDKGFDTIDIRYPPLPSSGNVRPVVAGNVCVDGTVFESWCWHPSTTGAQYTVGYSPLNAGTFSPVDPANPTYEIAVVADPLASWDTVALGVPDGTYDLQVVAQNDCGQARSETREVVVDNTPPVASIDSLRNCDYTEGLVQIVGTALDANIAAWTLQYVGGNASSWVTIATGTTSVVNDVLGTWDTSNLPVCAYAVRLVVTDKAVIGCGGPLRHRSEYVVTVNVGFCGDFDADDDGDVDLIDFGAFQDVFNGPHP
jgi:hypothetical protein